MKAYAYVAQKEFKKRCFKITAAVGAPGTKGAPIKTPAQLILVHIGEVGKTFIYGWRTGAKGATIKT